LFVEGEAIVTISRRTILASAGAAAATAVASRAMGQSFAFKPNQRYPDSTVEILDPSFAKYRLYSSTLEQVASGMRWAEGPVYFPDGGYLLVSDIPNNRIMKYSEKDGSFTVFRSPSNYANGNTRDRQGVSSPASIRSRAASRAPRRTARSPCSPTALKASG
jgi:gluconolactonase